MDRNVTKEGLLKLKKSKPIPITAHTGEIIVPCVYTEVVGDFMKKKGIKLPLDVHKLAELRRIAQATGKDEGYAKGTKNLKSRKVKLPKKNTVQIKGKNIVGGPISSNDMISIKIGQPKPRARQARQPKPKEDIRLPPPLLPDSNQRGFTMINPPNFNLIRPFSTSAPNANQAIPVQPHPDSLIHQKQQEEKYIKALEHIGSSFERNDKLVTDSRDILRKDMVYAIGYLVDTIQDSKNATASSSSSSSFITPNPFVDQKSRIEEIKEYKDAEGKHGVDENPDFTPIPPKEPPPKDKRPKKPITPKKPVEPEDLDLDFPDVKETPDLESDEEEELKKSDVPPVTDPRFRDFWKDLQRRKRITRKLLSQFDKYKAGDTDLRNIARQGLGIMFNMTPDGRHYGKADLIKLILDSQR